MTATFSKAAAADVVFTVAPVSTGLTLTLKLGAATVNTSNYTYASNALTIKKEYLTTLANGVKSLTLVMSDGGNVAVSVTVAD